MRLFQYFLICRSSFIPVCSCNILVHNSIENVNRCVRTLLSVQGTEKKAKNLLTHRNAAHLSIYVYIVCYTLDGFSKHSKHSRTHSHHRHLPATAFLLPTVR